MAQVNLDNLIGETTFGLNRIFLAFPKTQWRPTYWVMADHHSGDDWPLSQILSEDAKFLIRDDFRSAFEPYRSKDNIEYFHRCELHDHMNVESDGLPTEWHLPKYCRYGGGLFIGMQKAVLLGATQIVLLGCDLWVPRDGDEDVNHFDPAYCKRKWAPSDYDRISRTMIRAHENAKRSCDKLGVEVVNCSGGKLEVYPRRPLQEVL